MKCVHFVTDISLIIFIILFYATGTKNYEIDVKLSRIWGPGLNPANLVLPARYFFIEAVDKHNESFTFSPVNGSGEVFKINISGHNFKGRPCRIWTQIFDRLDGTFIIRYKLYEPCQNLIIEVKYDEKHVSNSPYKMEGTIYSEGCNCPVGKLENMIISWECRIQNQIEEDLAPFQSIDWNAIRNEIVDKYDRPHAVSLCHYVIKDNSIYRKCYGKYVGFKMFMDSILLSLTRKTLVPDLEFFVNLGDWPLAEKNSSNLYPIFSWCGSKNNLDIVMPTYDITESSLESMGRVSLDMLSVQGNAKLPWEERISKVFWRGRDSNRHRLNLILMGRKHPEFFNVSLTNFFFFKNEEHIYGPKAEYVSFFKFFDYKYQLTIDGTVASYRTPYLLAGGSLVFKQESKYYEHFYNELQPNIHFIMIKEDLSDLIEKLQWALSHDSEAKSIADNGRRFANEKLLPKDVLCYYAQLLHQFSKRLVSEVKIHEGMEKVEQVGSNCECVDSAMKDEL